MTNYSYRNRNRKLKEAASRKLPSRKRRMNEDYDAVYYVDYEGDYFDRLQDKGIINFGDVVDEVKNIAWSIARDVPVVVFGYNEIEIRELTQEEYDKFEEKLPKHLREWYQDLLEYNGLSESKKRSSRKRPMKEDAEEEEEKRDHRYIVDYEIGDYSELLYQGLIHFSDVFEKVQSLLRYYYPEAEAVKLGANRIAVVDLTEDEREFIEDDLQNELESWYENIEADKLW